MLVTDAIDNHKELKIGEISLSVWFKKHTAMMSSKGEEEKSIIQRYLKGDPSYNA
tara:strand:+ start:1462 stop:1626 length:165 start_codon:yes stop_codon:yes gene_type:complete